jgi:hypothetical protein
MSEQAERVARVMIALGADTAGEAALEAAVQLAAALRAELAGLFIEDVNLMRVAELPFSREIGIASGLARPMDAKGMMRAFKSAAAQARGAVAKAAQGSGVQWTFEVVQGSGLAPLLSAGRTVDWLVIERSRVRAGGIPEWPHLQPHGRSVARRRTPRPVAVVFDGSVEAQRATLAARKFAHELARPLLVLLLAATTADASALRALAYQVLGENRARVHCVAVRKNGLAAIAGAAQRHHAAVLVWCDSTLRDDAQRLSEVLSALTCPLALTE